MTTKFLAKSSKFSRLQEGASPLFLGLLVALSMVLGSTLAFGQLDRGAIEGLVTDAQGSVTPGVAVTVTAVARNASVSSKTDGAGFYRVDNLVPGIYTVHFELSGFSTTEVTGVDVSAGMSVRLDTQLKVGATVQNVEVKAQAQLIDTSASNFSATLNEHTIDEMPLQGRDLMQLVYLFPGVNSNAGPPGTNFGFNSQFGTFPDPTNVLGSDVSVNGGEAGANAWYLDGSLNLSSYDENAIISPSPDAVQEFQLVSDGFAAQYGRTGGGVFSTVLKSGTNKLHGNVYEFLRNSATNARNPYTSISTTGTIIPDRVLHYNDFGGTLGGPVYIPKIYNGKNKTFFFTSIDKRILHLWGEQVFTVPTERMRAGDFGEDPNAATKGLWDPFTTVGPDNNGIFARSAFGTPTAGNPNGCTGMIVGGVAVNPSSATCNFATSIPANRIDSIAKFFLNGYPAPNYISPLPGCPTASDGVALCNNYQGAVGTAMSPWNSSIKIDHQVGEKHHIFGEWLYERGAYDNYAVPWTGPAFSVGSFGFGAKPPVVFRSQIGTIGDTYTISPTVVNQFRYTFSRQFFGTSPYINGPYASQEDLAAVKQEMKAFYTTTDYPVPWIDVNMPYGPAESLGVQQWNSEDIPGQSHTFSDDLTKIIGKHTVKVGIMYRLDHTSYDLTGFSTPRFYGTMANNPSSGQSGGGGLEQFELGAPQAANGFTVGNVAPWERYRYWGLYGQDDIRITHSFSVNLGLRWDVYGFFSSQLKPQSRFCPTCMNTSTGLPGEVQYDGSPGWAAGSDLYSPNWNNFQPRVNFSWSPFDNKKTVIRGGYDVFVPNSTNASNLGVQVAPPGYQWYGYWQGSYSPSTCAPLHGACPPWQLDTLTDANAATYPVPFSTTPPALSRDPLLGQSLYYNAKPPHDPFVQSWTLEVQRELPGNMLVTIGYAGNHGTHLQGGVGFLLPTTQAAVTTLS